MLSECGNNTVGSLIRRFRRKNMFVADVFIYRLAGKKQRFYSLAAGRKRARITERKLAYRPVDLYYTPVRPEQAHIFPSYWRTASAGDNGTVQAGKTFHGIGFSIAEGFCTIMRHHFGY